MTLSVVIPAHNAATTLAATLDSLLAQTRGDWRAVIVDDGSTDATRHLAEQYAARDNRFSLLSGDSGRQGVSAARNRGIAASNGRWLLFLDSDDTVEPTFVERMVGRLEGQPGAKVAYCGSRRVTADGRRGPPWIATSVARAPFETLARDCPVVIHGVVLERALVVELGGFDPDLRTCEDTDLLQRIARTGVPFLLVPEALALYHMRAGSLSADARAMLADFEFVIDRAFAPDPRVAHPDPRHVRGADPAIGSKERALAFYSLWCAAVDIGQGGSGSGFVQPLTGDCSQLVEPCRQTIMQGLTHGGHKLPDEPLPPDERLAAAVRRLLAELESKTGQSGLARVLEFALEPEVFRSDRPSTALIAGNTLLLRQDIADLQPIPVQAGVDRVHVEFRSGARVVGRIVAPVLGGFSARDVMRLALDSVNLVEIVRSGGLMIRPSFWLQAAWAASQLGVAVVAAKLARRAVPLRSLRALAKAAVGEAALAVAGAGTGGQEIAGLIAEGQAMAERTTPPAPPTPSGSTQRATGGRRAYWEAIYCREDPWAYGSPYEQLKYRRTLDLLPAVPIARAMELACSEGRFTEMLAPKVGQLIAADISETALGRARKRCSHAGHIEYRRLDLFDDPLPGDLDLVVCSEVLYDLAGRGELERVAARLAATLAPGGHLLAAHAFVLKDDPAHTGYDWDCAFGAKAIADVLAATPGLALERSLEAGLYRIDLFRRLRAGEPAPQPRIDTVALGPAPEPDFARHVVWDGVAALRAEVQVRERTDRLPVLLYHRIAAEGPAELARYRQTPAAFAEQMRWLRRHGYHAVTSSELLRHLASGQPFAGRPVLISFDDAYCDFHDTAWPILRAHDFTAEVFVVTDRVGGHADWDLAYGPTAPLMDWPQIQALAAAGVCFGSHMASHSHMAELSSREIVLEAARSRAALQRALGADCRSIAAPFGEGDERFVRIARQCGYESGFTTDPGLAALGQDVLRLPRVEVIGGWSLDAFVEAVQAP